MSWFDMNGLLYSNRGAPVTDFGSNFPHYTVYRCSRIYVGEHKLRFKCTLLSVSAHM